MNLHDCQEKGDISCHSFTRIVSNFLSALLCIVILKCLILFHCAFSHYVVLSLHPWLTSCFPVLSSPPLFSYPSCHSPLISYIYCAVPRLCVFVGGGRAGAEDERVSYLHSRHSAVVDFGGVISRQCFLSLSSLFVDETLDKHTLPCSLFFFCLTHFALVVFT